MTDLTNMLHDAGDVDVVRASLVRIKTALNTAAYDYAHASLGAAQEACEAALSAAPCVTVLSHISEYQRFAQKTQEALDVCMTSVAMLLQVEETGDPTIDQMNAEIKVDSTEKHVIASLLEGAHSRVRVAIHTMPETVAPGARCIPSKVKIINGSAGS